MSHGPIDETQIEFMNKLAKVLDDALNPEERKVGFVLLTYNFEDGTGRVNYIGNGDRDDVRVALKELLARWEGRLVEGGEQ